MGDTNVVKSPEIEQAVKKEQQDRLKQLLTEGTTGQIAGLTIAGAGVVAGLLTSWTGVGAIAGLGGTVVGLKWATGAKQRAVTREKMEKRFTEPRPAWREKLDELFEGTSGILVGTGITVAGAAALFSGALPLAGALAAGGATVFGLHTAFTAPKKEQEAKQWKEELVGA